MTNTLLNYTKILEVKRIFISYNTSIGFNMNFLLINGGPACPVPAKRVSKDNGADEQVANIVASFITHLKKILSHRKWTEFFKDTNINFI